MTEWNGPDRRASDRMAEGRLEEIVNRGVTRAVNEAVPKAIDETLCRIGIDISDPIAMQGQMAYLKEAAIRSKDPDVIADRAFTRESRMRCEAFWKKFYDTIFGSFIRWGLAAAFVGALVLLGLKTDVFDKFIQ